jgi:hypothetical protein
MEDTRGSQMYCIERAYRFQRKCNACVRHDLVRQIQDVPRQYRTIQQPQRGQLLGARNPT